MPKKKVSSKKTDHQAEIESGARAKKGQSPASILNRSGGGVGSGTEYVK